MIDALSMMNTKGDIVQEVAATDNNGRGKMTLTTTARNVPMRVQQDNTDEGLRYRRETNRRRGIAWVRPNVTISARYRIRWQSLTLLVLDVFDVYDDDQQVAFKEVHWEVDDAGQG